MKILPLDKVVLQTRAINPCNMLLVSARGVGLHLEQTAWESARILVSQSVRRTLVHELVFSNATINNVDAKNDKRIIVIIIITLDIQSIGNDIVLPPSSYRTTTISYFDSPRSTTDTIYCIYCPTGNKKVLLKK